MRIRMTALHAPLYLSHIARSPRVSDALIAWNNIERLRTLRALLVTAIASLAYAPAAHRGITANNNRKQPVISYLIKQA